MPNTKTTDKEPKYAWYPIDEVKILYQYRIKYEELRQELEQLKREKFILLKRLETDSVG